MAKSWIDDEPGWADARQELRAVRSRLRLRWPLALLITVLVTALGTTWRARKQRTFQSSIVMRVTEDDFDPTTSPPTSSQLQEHLSHIALSRRTLLKLIAEHDLYRPERNIDPVLALEVMREDIELDVVSNYFSRERYSEDPPRSARISITYIGRQPERTLAVVRHLGRLVEAEQQTARRDYARSAARGVDEIVSRLRDDAITTERKIASVKLSLPELDPTAARLAESELLRLDAQLRDLRRDIALHTERGTNFELRSEFEGKAMGLRFELVDPGRQATVTLTNAERLTVFAFLALLFVFPVAAIGVGTFDSRVRDSQGLRRLGLTPLGEIPAFSGAHLGSLKQRRSAKKNPLPPAVSPVQSG